MAAPSPTPGSVIAASVLLYVCAAASVLGALVLFAGGALGNSLSDIPFAGIYTTKAQVIGFGGGVALLALAAADIVLGVRLPRGARSARTATLILSAMVAVLSLASPLAPLCLITAAAVIVLVTGPRPARRHFQRQAVEVG